MAVQNERQSELLEELDIVLKHRYHQSLDEILHELYIHDVITTTRLDVDQIVSVLQSISSLKEITGNIIERYCRHRN